MRGYGAGHGTGQDALSESWCRLDGLNDLLHCRDFTICKILFFFNWRALRIGNSFQKVLISLSQLEAQG